MRRWFAILLATSVVICTAANGKDKVSKKGKVPVYDTTTGLQVGEVKFEVTADYLTVDLDITDGEPGIVFYMNVTTVPLVLSMLPELVTWVTDDKGRAHATLTYGIAVKYPSFQATLTAYEYGPSVSIWTAGPVTLSPKFK